MFSYQEEQAWVSAIKTPDLEFQVIQLNASLYSLSKTLTLNTNENVIIENKSYHIFKKGSTTISLVCITYEIIWRCQKI
jgi:hypothetical protein